MRKGDRVTWTSQAQGYQRTKTGTIVAVVPAKIEPNYCAMPDGTWLDGPGMSRDHESYLVQVDNRKKLYWPRVSALKMVDEPDPADALKEIHQIAEWFTFRGHCSDACREAWAKVCRLARDAAHQGETKC